VQRDAEAGELVHVARHEDETVVRGRRDDEQVGLRSRPAARGAGEGANNPRRLR